MVPRISFNRIIWLCYTHFIAQNLIEYSMSFKKCHSKVQILDLAQICKEYICQLSPQFSPITHIQHTVLYVENHLSFSLFHNFLILFPMHAMRSTVLVWRTSIRLCFVFSKRHLKRPLPLTCLSFLSTMIKSLFTVYVDF